jgi:hypothetical protein
MVRKRRVGGGWALVKVAGNKDGGSIDGKVIKAGSFACWFSMSVLSEVAMFAVFLNIAAF